MDHPLLNVVCKHCTYVIQRSLNQNRAVCAIARQQIQDKTHQRVTLGMVCHMADDVNDPPENARTMGRQQSPHAR
eukprot:11215556-Lingulodinium_polyedra.AAC.1